MHTEAKTRVILRVTDDDNCLNSILFANFKALADKLRAYAYMPTEGIWDNPEKAGEIAVQLVEEGNTACKLDPFMPLFPLPRDFPLKTIRRAAETSS